VIPVFNHERALPAVVARLRPFGLSCILVDDGSAPAGAAVLDRTAAAEVAWVTLLRRPRNGGKGAAVKDGLARARALGFSHAVQIDADGQHDCADLPRLLDAARREPGALISGRPLFDGSIPPVRFYGRYLTHGLVWLETLSFAIRDSMCGFRVYPLAPVLALLARQHTGDRMDFDTDIMVRLYWAGVPVRQLATRVHYPSDGVSHFRLLRDNALMVLLHARLIFGMLWRAPILLWRKVVK
jgi:glycosyltransferase involved in cell wall biosynthesis